MSAELLAVTVALATTPPEASVTTPVILPVVDTWADEMVGTKRTARMTKRIGRLRTLRTYGRAADTTPPPKRQMYSGACHPLTVVRDSEAPRWRDCIRCAAPRQGF